MLYLYNFRNPNRPVPVDVTWSPYDKDYQAYIELDLDIGEHSKKHYLAAKEVHFWNDVIPGLVMSDSDGSTAACSTSGAGQHMISWVLAVVSMVIGMALA